MKKDTKLYLILIIIVVLVIAIIFILKKNGDVVDKETAICIGENSELYVQLGCHFCEIQEEMFGKNYQYLTSIDCFYERAKCAEAEILRTPTWIINNERYETVLSIDQLKQLTGC